MSSTRGAKRRHDDLSDLPPPSTTLEPFEVMKDLSALPEISFNGRAQAGHYQSLVGEKYERLGSGIGDWLCSFLNGVGERSKPQSTGSFPLPTTNLQFLLPSADENLVALVSLACFCLNSFYGCPGSSDLEDVHPRTHTAVLELGPELGGDIPSFRLGSVSTNKDH